VTECWLFDSSSSLQQRHQDIKRTLQLSLTWPNKLAELWFQNLNRHETHQSSNRAEVLRMGAWQDHCGACCTDASQYQKWSVV